MVRNLQRRARVAKVSKTGAAPSARTRAHRSRGNQGGPVDHRTKEPSETTMSIKPSPAIDLRRPRSVILAFLGVVLACASALAPGLAAQETATAPASPPAADEPPAPPSPLLPVNPTFDSGDMVKGDVVEHTFTLRNTGTE